MAVFEIKNFTREKIESKIIDNYNYFKIARPLMASLSFKTTFTQEFIKLQNDFNKLHFLSLIENKGMPIIQEIVKKAYNQNLEFKGPFKRDASDGYVTFYEISNKSEAVHSQPYIINYGLNYQFYDNNITIPTSIQYSSTDKFFQDFISFQLEIFKGQNIIVTVCEDSGNDSLVFYNKNNDKIICEINRNKGLGNIYFLNPRLTSNKALYIEDYILHK